MLEVTYTDTIAEEEFIRVVIDVTQVIGDDCAAGGALVRQV